MNIYKIIGLLFFYAAIICGFVVVIYNWILIYKITKYENIKMADLIIARKKPTTEWKGKWNTIKPLISVSLFLFVISVFLILIGFMIE